MTQKIEPRRAVRQAKKVFFFERATFFKNRHFRSPWSSGGVPGAAGDTADSIMGVPGQFRGVFFSGRFRVGFDAVEGLGG